MSVLSGKRVLITGASKGIGAAAARAFAEAGAKVGLAARSRAAVGDLAAEIGPSARALPCDVAVWAEVEGAVAFVAKQLKQGGTALFKRRLDLPVGDAHQMHLEGLGQEIFGIAAVRTRE